MLDVYFYTQFHKYIHRIPLPHIGRYVPIVNCLISHQGRQFYVH